MVASIVYEKKTHNDYCRKKKLSLVAEKMNIKNHLPFSAAAITIRSRNDENKAALTLLSSDSGEDNDGCGW